jgi:nucleoid DNA-binding protein
MAKNTKVNKVALIEEIASKLGIAKSQSEAFVNTLIESITGHLSKGTEVNITGFGAFRISHRKARKGVNPQTGKSMQIPASKTVSYKAGKTIKEAVS